MSPLNITPPKEPATDVMIFIIFSPKNLAKILAFFAQTTVSFCKNYYFFFFLLPSLSGLQIP
jgi:hypothetical protein